MGGSDLYSGTLDLLILRTLQHQPMHAYGIGRVLRERSEGVLDVAEGVLYPALHRLEARGWVGARWDRSGGGRRAKFYELTSAGRKRLAGAREGWERVTGAVRAVLDLPGGTP